MPVAAYAFGRLAGFAHPVQPSCPRDVGVSLNTSTRSMAATCVDARRRVLFTLRWCSGCCSSASSPTRFGPAACDGSHRFCSPRRALPRGPCDLRRRRAVVLWAFQRSRMRTIQILVPVGLVGFLLASFGCCGSDLTSSTPHRWVTASGAVLAQHVPELGNDRDPHPCDRGRDIRRVSGQPDCDGARSDGGGSSIGFAILPSGLVYNGRWLPSTFQRVTARRVRRR